jgi:hypothetical protein
MAPTISDPERCHRPEIGCQVFRLWDTLIIFKATAVPTLPRDAEFIGFCPFPSACICDLAIVLLIRLALRDTSDSAVGRERRAPLLAHRTHTVKVFWNSRGGVRQNNTSKENGHSKQES